MRLRSAVVVCSSLLALPLFAANVDLQATLTHDLPRLGDSFNLDLRIANRGPDDATDVRFTERIPGTSFYTFPNGTCSFASDSGDAVTCSVETIAAGATVTLRAHLRTPASTVTATAVVTSAGTELAADDNMASAEIVPYDVPDLVPTLSLTRPLVGHRRDALQLKIENRGGGDAHAVALWTIDAELTDPPQACVATDDPRTWKCQMPVAVNPSSSISFSASVKGAPSGTPFSTHATVTSDRAESDTANNEASLTGTFAAAGDLSATGTANLDAEGALHVAFTIANGAGDPASNIRLLFDTFNAATLVSTEGTGVHCLSSVSCSMDDLPGNASRTVTIVATPSRAGFINVMLHLTWGDPALQLSAFAEARLTIYKDIAVTNTNDSGDGSLRAAILQANAASTDGNTPIRINFRIPPPAPPSGWYTIAPLTPLPPISGYQVVVDGSTQTANTGDTNLQGPEVEVTGIHSVPGNGFVVQGTIIEIAGLAINGFPANGILITRQPNSFGPDLNLHDNYIGTDPTGERAVPNGERGVRLVNGRVDARSNVISGNNHSGVYIDNGFATLFGDRIGVSPTDAPLGNGNSGVFFYSPSPDPLDNRVLQGNVIAWNGQFGISAISPGGLVVRENSLHDNGGMSIDIGLDGPSPSPATGRYDSLVERPEVTSARYDDATGDTIIVLGLHAASVPAARTTYTLYLYSTTHLNRAGFAEGETFLLKVATANASTQVRVHADLRGHYITALTERLIDYGDLQLTGSSELCLGVKVPE